MFLFFLCLNQFESIVWKKIEVRTPLSCDFFSLLVLKFLTLSDDDCALGSGKTYRIRVHNVGVATSLNFRIQSHNMLLAETEGSYTWQQNYTNLDIHVGQSYSILVTMDQNASTDYYIVASARFVNESLWTRVTGVAILHYSNSKGKASGPLPDPPNDFYDKSFSMNQAKSIRFSYTTCQANLNV